MSKPLIIFLWCLGGILLIWLIIIVFVTIILLVLNKRIKRGRDGINITLAQKYDVSVVLAKLLLDSNVELSDEIKEVLNLNNKPNFKLCNTLERKRYGLQLNQIIDELIQISSNVEVEDHKRLLTLKNAMIDLDKRYKHRILIYNNKVWTYNYWLHFLPFSLISKLFKLKEKKEITYNNEMEETK